MDDPRKDQNISRLGLLPSPLISPTGATDQPSLARAAPVLPVMRKLFVAVAEADVMAMGVFTSSVCFVALPHQM